MPAWLDLYRGALLHGRQFGRHFLSVLFPWFRCIANWQEVPPPFSNAPTLLGNFSCYVGPFASYDSWLAGVQDRPNFDAEKFRQRAGALRLVGVGRPRTVGAPWAWPWIPGSSRDVITSPSGIRIPSEGR